MGNISSTNSGIDNVEVLFTKDEIADTVQELAEQINEDYNTSTDLVLVCKLKSAVFFMADLSRAITIPHTHFYANTPNDNYSCLKGKDVIIIDTLIKTGKTLSDLVNNIKRFEPKTVVSCILLKKENTQTYYCGEIKYYGMYFSQESNPIGYGLDFDEEYRELNFIGVFSEGSTEGSTEGSDSD
jgi:hypoxanthine phosphoribosyltransferase